MRRNPARRLHLAIVVSLIVFWGAMFSSSLRVMAQSGGSRQSTAPQSANPPTTSSAASSTPQAAAEAKPKTAAEAYKNIQVLKDIREDQLLPSMRYITSALGVRCDFCHVPDHFDSDDKPEKGRAREMMKMMMAINADNFHNRREVTCYTCHGGHSHPTSIPVVADAATLTAQAAASPAGAGDGPGDHAESGSGGGGEAPAASLPSVDEILAKYAQALGGADAIQKIASRSEKGTVDIPSRNIHETMEVLRKAPDKALATLHARMGDVVEGFDGTAGWQSRGGRGVEAETGDQLVRVREWAEFIPGLDLKTQYSRSVVSGIEKIDGQDAYRVMTFRKGGGMERLYFDTQSGLLVRLDTRIDSPLGALPQETDFQDYKAVDGVKIPYTIRVARMDGATIYKWEQVEANVSIDDSRFAMPAASAPPAKP